MTIQYRLPVITLGQPTTYETHTSTDIAERLVSLPEGVHYVLHQAVRRVSDGFILGGSVWPHYPPRMTLGECMDSLIRFALRELGMEVAQE